MNARSQLLFGAVAALSAASINAAEVVIADPVSVNLSAWTYGSGNNVSVGAPTYNGAAGGFKGALSNAGAYSSASFETYCVELGQDFNWNVTYNDYKIIKGDTYGQWAGNPDTAGKIGQLMTYVGTLGALSSEQSSGVQLALWELIYETGSTYGLGSGSFANTPTISNLFGDGLLSNFASTTSLYTVDVLKNENRQDFLLLTVVPEPEAYVLALASMGVIGFFGRRRRVPA